MSDFSLNVAGYGWTTAHSQDETRNQQSALDVAEASHRFVKLCWNSGWRMIYLTSVAYQGITRGRCKWARRRSAE